MIFIFRQILSLLNLQYDFKIMSSRTNHNIKHFERVESHQSLFIIHNIKYFLEEINESRMHMGNLTA